MPIWLVCLIFGELLSVVLGKLIQLMSRRTKLLTIDYASFALIFGFVFWSIFFGKR
jgi:YtcA family